MGWYNGTSTSSAGQDNAVVERAASSTASPPNKGRYWFKQKVRRKNNQDPSKEEASREEPPKHQRTITWSLSGMDSPRFGLTVRHVRNIRQMDGPTDALDELDHRNPQFCG